MGRLKRLFGTFFSRFPAAIEELWIALFAWIPTPLGMLLRLAAWRPFFARCISPRFGSHLAISGMRNIDLGKAARIGRGCILSAGCGKLRIGDFSALSPNVDIGADSGEVLLGCHVAIGPGTVIRAANHRFSQCDVPIMQQGHVPERVIIDDDVWIGANCVITPGVHIGRGAVVGAGAVVTRDVPPFSIVGGVPARLIGWRDPSRQGGKHASEMSCI